jgi:hypothetical protein
MIGVKGDVEMEYVAALLLVCVVIALFNAYYNV